MKPVFVDGNGKTARRRWPDSAWPLRRADGKTWAESRMDLICAKLDEMEAKGAKTS